MRQPLYGCWLSEGGLPVDDPRVLASARATGADVLACLSAQARTIKGIGNELGPAILIARYFRGSSQSAGSGADAEGFRCL